MSSKANTSRDAHLVIPIVATLLFHVALGGGLFAAGELLDLRGERITPIEVEIVQPPPRKKQKKPEVQPEPKKPEKPEVKVEPEVKKPKVRRKRVATRPPPTEQPPPTADPAPGENQNDDAPAPVVSMPNLGIGGSGPPVAIGKPRTRRVGPGGTGTNTGGGGKAGGTGGPRPVSIAAIKRRAQPLNPDLDTSKLYPAEAKRLGIEGQVKVALVVDKTGKVSRTRLVTRLGHGLDELAVKLARRLRFKPAVDTDDRPVADKVVWTFTFVLPE